MTKHTHTPGPWNVGHVHAGQRFNANCIIARSPQSGDFGLQAPLVAQITGVPTNKSVEEIPAYFAEGLANAYLIAAAPDLLAALEEALAIHENVNAKKPYGDRGSKMLAQCRAAIAKARGEAA